MAAIADGGYEQVGTFNGNPLAMAAARATLTEVLTDEAYAHLDALAAPGARRPRGCASTGTALPWRVVTRRRQGMRDLPGRPGAQLPRLPRRSTSARATLHWLVQHNGGVFLPPWGKVEQWLLSVQHTEDDVDRFVANFGRSPAW